MGADFLIAWVEDTDRESWLTRIDQYTDRTLIETARNVDGEEMTPHHVRNRLRYAVDYISSTPRDTAVIPIEGRNYVFAGGMSWGDDPSEGFKEISWLMEAEAQRNYEELYLGPNS